MENGVEGVTSLVFQLAVILAAAKIGGEVTERLLKMPAVLGELVDVASLSGVIVFGAVITLFAVIGKVAGSGLPALAAGFNFQGSLRIGVGMLPRGEVALIMAGIGISKGVIGAYLYSVAIAMTIVTTILAPPILSVLFRSGSDGTHAKPVEQEG